MNVVKWLGLTAVVLISVTSGVFAAPTGGSGTGTAGKATADKTATGKDAADKTAAGKDELLPGYTDVKMTALKARLADYNGKKITFTGSMYRYDTEVGYLAEASGYHSNRDYHLYFSYRDGMSSYYYEELPVLAKREKKITDMLTVIDAGANVRVYGKVRRFRSPADYDTIVRYYIELDLIKPVDADAGNAAPPTGGAAATKGDKK